MGPRICQYYGRGGQLCRSWIDSEVEEILGKTRGGSEGKERKLWSGSGFVNKS